MRKDSENTALLDSKRSEHAQFQNRLIRAESEFEHAERALGELMQSAIELSGSSDLEDVRKKIKQNYERNTVETDEYVAIHERVARELAALDARV